ncbi:MAG TPA: VWA domain-containing protein [Candidatus Limnocylindrales bacterium]|nr:VWA domain-containing protein [Candidatus Limnocylindrales bacterium]
MQQQANFAETIVDFCRFARSEGLTAGVKESVDALQAAEAVGVADRETLKSALRAVLCSSKEEWDLFDQLFWVFWRDADRPTEREKEKRRAKAKKDDRPPQGAVVSVLGDGGKGRAAEEDGGRAVVGATANERLKKADFSQVAQSDLRDLEKIALRLLRQMSLRLSRRLKMTRLRGQVDLRRTIRRNISRGGDPMSLNFKGKKLQQDRLVVLVDISGSMNPYSLFLVRFAYALQKHFKRVDTFLFSTQLAEVTGALRGRQLREALKLLGEQAAGWSGGTKIGESLREFNLFHARRLLARDTIFMILSDGWDTGEPELLETELKVVRRRARKVIWLNPLLGMSEYRPETRGMSAALPHIDVFAPGHNLESLLALERHLGRR